MSKKRRDEFSGVQRRHTVQPVTLRRDDDGKSTIVGHAAVFYRDDDEGTEYELASWGGHRILERIMPGAFDRAVSERHDARCLFNHDASLILGRVKAGTCRLSVDGRGLVYEADAPDTQAGRDVVVSLERGDVTGSSFAFIPKRVVWIEEEDRDIRQIEDLDLHDVSPVTFPAYEGADAGVRSSEADCIRAEWEAWKSGGDGEAVAVRSRLVELGLV